MKFEFGMYSDGNSHYNYYNSASVIESLNQIEKHKAAKDGLEIGSEIERFANRRNLLVDLDKNLISGKSANSLDFYKSQAYDVMLGSAKDAFDVDKESEKVKEMYGQDSVGKQLLLARRLVEYGTRFVTLHYGGWDMHSNI